MVNERFKSIIDGHSDVMLKYEQEILNLSRSFKAKQDEYIGDIINEFTSWLHENRFFKTHDGYIAINCITGANVTGFARIIPQVRVNGFYIRGIDCPNPFTTPYGYYDRDAGFLLNDLTPISEELFCEKVKEVCEKIIDSLPYKPNHYYRSEDDEFAVFLEGARNSKIDVEYYPEVKISVIV